MDQKPVSIRSGKNSRHKRPSMPRILIIGGICLVGVLVGIWISLTGRPKEEAPEAKGILVKSEAKQPEGTEVPAEQSTREASQQEQPAKPELPEGTLIVESHEYEGVRVSTIGVNVDDLVGELLWSKDGRYLYLLEKKGLLRKLELPGFVPSAELNVNEKASWVSMSSEGLVVSVPALEELWVVNAENLEILRKITMRKMRVVTASRQSPLAYGISAAFPQGRYIEVFDTAAGRTALVIGAEDLGQIPGVVIPKDTTPLSRCETQKVTPDGKYLVCSDWGALHRCRVNGIDLVYEEVLKTKSSWTFTDDSQYLAIASSRENVNQEFLERYPDFSKGIALFPVTNLQVPAIVLNATETVSPNIGQDPLTGNFYVLSVSIDLIVYDSTGTRIREYEFPEYDSFLELAVNPAGGGFVARSQRNLSWVQMMPNS